MNTALLHILGSVDGTLEARETKGDAWQADQQALASYDERGAVLIRNPGDDGAGRKRFERACQSLQASELVIIQRKFIALTPSGDDEARRLAGLPVLADSMDLLAAIASPDRKHRWSDGSISESSLCGIEPLPPGVIGKERTPARAVNMLMAHMAPLLSAKLAAWRIVPRFDGVYLYYATDAGRKMASRGDAGKWFRSIKTPRKFKLPDAYSDSWQLAYNARASATPARPNLIHHLDVVDPPEAKNPSIQFAARRSKETRK
ncbi:MAG: hypothetical protein V2A34_02145 [Lentisphaerota bacterium]